MHVGPTYLQYVGIKDLCGDFRNTLKTFHIC